MHTSVEIVILFKTRLSEFT